ncbi:hypothetical protein CVT26_011291 [Gymnopilus dilepis]|uniref:Uncharacterized protein n=1 Tax=Gymnopilus dilepis TaxID=231916 RepID=A0A409VJH4_9AGAR|nr:hypothetical protein CVT26_011291 [Gymnopilus dilepis]
MNIFQYSRCLGRKNDASQHRVYPDANPPIRMIHHHGLTLEQQNGLRASQMLIVSNLILEEKRLSDFNFRRANRFSSTRLGGYDTFPFHSPTASVFRQVKHWPAFFPASLYSIGSA